MKDRDKQVVKHNVRNPAGDGTEQRQGRFARGNHVEGKIIH